MIDKKKIIEYFKENNLVPRDSQKEVLLKIANNWDNKKYFVVSAPMGVGKTHIALALSDAVKRTYITTASKQLQKQYVETDPGITSISGKSNYRCGIDPTTNCATAPCISDSQLKQKCISGNICPYYSKKEAAINAQSTLSNFHYFMFSSFYGFLRDGEEFRKRDLLIVDEAHEFPDVIASIGAMMLDIDKLIDLNICHPNAVWEDENDIMTNENLISEIYDNALELSVKLMSKIKSINVKVKSATHKTAPKLKKELVNVTSEFNKIDSIAKSIDNYFATKDKDRWVFDIDQENNICKLSPLKASYTFKKNIEPVADKFIFMSATILNHELFCREMGIPMSDTMFIDVDSPFDPANSPIHKVNVGSMNYKNIDKSLINVVKATENIMEAFGDEKGIIHSGNYKISNYIYNNIDKKYKKRLLGAFKGKYRLSNEELVKKHEESSEPTVLISPSLTTGVDLKDELSRFQIITKLPFISLNDKRVKAKMEDDKDWYLNQMFLTLLQSSGRSTRSNEDWAETFILDSAFEFWTDKYSSKLPIWFKHRIENG